MPGAKLDGASIYELLNDYRVTFTAAVPTVWLMLLQHLEANNAKLPHLKKVVIGGSACPRAMTKTFEDVYGVEVCHAWGMTEMSPLGTLGSMKPEYAEPDRRGAARHPGQAGPSAVRRRDEDRRRRRQGAAARRQDLRPPQGARSRRSPEPISRRSGSVLDDDGFFDTGDVVHHRPPRLHADHRPLQGRDQVGRRMDFLDRSGEPRRRPSQGGGGRRHRREASEMGRAAAC